MLSISSSTSGSSSFVLIASSQSSSSSNLSGPKLRVKLIQVGLSDDGCPAKPSKADEYWGWSTMMTSSPVVDQSGVGLSKWGRPGWLVTTVGGCGCQETNCSLSSILNHDVTNTDGDLEYVSMVTSMTSERWHNNWPTSTDNELTLVQVQRILILNDVTHC